MTLKQWKNVMIGIPCALILFSGIVSAGAAPQESGFQDVTAEHWGKLSQTPEPEIFMPRKYAAKLIANASGRNYDFDDSIQYLLDSGLSEGKTDPTVPGFRGDDLLTRAEAVTFIQHVRSKLDSLYPSSESIHEYDPATVISAHLKSIRLW